jgi:hypothetical protein
MSQKSPKSCLSPRKQEGERGREGEGERERVSLIHNGCTASVGRSQGPRPHLGTSNIYTDREFPT